MNLPGTPEPLAAAGFTAFSPSHWWALACFVVGVPLVLALGRAKVDQTLVARCFAVAICGVTIPLQVLDLLPGRFGFDTSLPLQLCDFAWMVAVVALWTGRPTPVAMTYFWGLTLTTQGLLTPALQATWPHPRFIAFWAMHFLIVWAAVYLVWGVRDPRTRPDWHGYRRTVAITLVWLVSVYCFNAATGTNYGYVNRKPGSRSALDYLGPWPWYLLAEIAIVALVWGAMTWPWARRLRSAP